MSHFYTTDPEPAPFYEVPYTDPSKGMRSTTLADARKVDALPSPNTIMSILAKPGIERWKRNIYGECIAETILEFGDCDHETQAFADTLFAERMDAAPSAGTDIHAAIENAICERMGRDLPHPEKDVDPRIVSAAMAWLDEHEITPAEVEKIFANPALGYGGKVDLIGEWHGRPCVVDWKSVNTTEGKKIGDYWKDKTPLLAAYAMGLGQVSFRRVDCLNVFISRNEPGRIEHRLYTQEEMLFGWKKFRLTHDLWCIENNYDPRKTQ